MQMVKCWMYSICSYYISKDTHNLSIESLSCECEFLLSRVAACIVLLSYLLICFCTAAAKMYSCTFIVLDKYSDLDTNKLSSIYRPSLCNISCLFPCFMTHCMFSFFRCLCFSSQKHFCLSRGIKNERGAKTTTQWTKHAKERVEGKKRGKFNTQPEGPRGVSNCVIKYVTGSLDVSVEAWSLCYYCAEACDAHTSTHTHTYRCTHTHTVVHIHKHINIHVHLMYYVGLNPVYTHSHTYTIRKMGLKTHKSCTATHIVLLNSLHWPHVKHSQILYTLLSSSISHCFVSLIIFDYLSSPL